MGPTQRYTLLMIKKEQKRKVAKFINITHFSLFRKNRRSIAVLPGCTCE